MALRDNPFFGQIAQGVDYLLADAAQSRAREQQQQEQQRANKTWMGQQAYRMLRESQMNPNVTEGSRAEAGNLLKQYPNLEDLGGVMYQPQYNPAQTKPGDELVALPDDPNNPIYKYLPGGANYAGKKMFRGGDLADLLQSATTAQTSESKAKSDAANKAKRDASTSLSDREKDTEKQIRTLEKQMKVVQDAAEQLLDDKELEMVIPGKDIEYKRRKKQLNELRAKRDKLLGVELSDEADASTTLSDREKEKVKSGKKTIQGF